MDWVARLYQHIPTDWPRGCYEQSFIPTVSTVQPQPLQPQANVICAMYRVGPFPRLKPIGEVRVASTSEIQGPKCMTVGSLDHGWATKHRYTWYNMILGGHHHLTICLKDDTLWIRNKFKHKGEFAGWTTNFHCVVLLPIVRKLRYIPRTRKLRYPRTRHWRFKSPFRLALETNTNYAYGFKHFVRLESLNSVHQLIFAEASGCGPPAFSVT